ncbi:RecQ family ATP-dependent DNA helicase [Pedobacter flavus]|uniref:ATP-dependent DNA helicase RecQ n=1 Tax=Pedobacter flavus TaxID=3113906 RepID=A0ABU7H2K4_9SPHI|nr:ATP-dependent DNA helicase RecQ [Pedobacter sp. VNH31]MEE1885532.1 ATP-dependent DNA helicase RecQ [Pedobacter sp. VNH31]
MPEVEILKKYWGYDSFRPLQQDIIRSVLDGEDALALMPTGGGKSICFQVPAMVMEGICLVISPLVALMKDQVEHLRNKGIAAEAIFAGMGKREIDIILDNCIFGNIKFLYLSPERLQSDLVRTRITYMNVNLLAIDEAHCISQWGYDFRPPYLKIAELRDLIPNVPVLALTATATEFVREDILEKLKIKHANVFVKSFARKNLSYVVYNLDDKFKKLLQIIDKVKGCGLIYVRNRRETAEVAAYLLRNSISADFYHAGLPTELRFKKQQLWMENKISVMVATNAFGMGIDKPDVRFVVHLDLPESLEAYYQEAGRAGRDGHKSYAVLLTNKTDQVNLKNRALEQIVEPAEIKKIYHSLGNFYQLAYGAGHGLSFDFDLIKFSKTFNYKPLKVINSLKYLSQFGYLELSENIFIPSRVMFMADHETVYKFQIEHKSYDNFIKILLRSYGGIFDHFTKINEAELANRLKVSYNEVINTLKYLESQELIQYLQQTDVPQLTFMVGRTQLSHMDIDVKFIKQRQEIHEKQIDSVIEYASKDVCRSILLLKYFNEITADKCGICDVCIAEKKRLKVNSYMEMLDYELITLLQSGRKNYEEIVEGIKDISEEKIINRLKDLLEAGKIKTDGIWYYLN